MRKGYAPVAAVLLLAACTAPPATVRDKLSHNLPETAIDQVSPSEIKGLYTVQAGSNVFYADASGRYAVFGIIYDLTTGQDLTAQRRAEAGKETFATLPFELAVKLGSGAKKAALFYAPLCPYCRAALDYLRQEKLTLYVFLLPLHEGSAERVTNILCSTDPAKALVEPQDNQPAPDDASLKRAKETTDQVATLAKRLGIQGTPTVFFSGGERIEGFDQQAYRQLLNDTQEVTR